MEHWIDGLTREEVADQLRVLGVKTRNIRALLNKYVIAGIVDQARRRGGWEGQRGVKGLYDHNSALQIYRAIAWRGELGVPLRLVKSTVMEAPVKLLYSVKGPRRGMKLELRFTVRIDAAQEDRRPFKYIGGELYKQEYKRIRAATKKLEKWYRSKRK